MSSDPDRVAASIPDSGKTGNELSQGFVKGRVARTIDQGGLEGKD